MTAERRFQSIWILTDGKIGDLVQCRGVARHLGCEDVSEREVNSSGLWALPVPFVPVPPQDLPDKPGSPLAPPFPDLVLASGRRTIPHLRLVRKQSPKTAIVFLKDPRWGGRSSADFIWAPAHDAMPSGSNISGGATTLSTHTSPHGLDEAVMRMAADRGTERFKHQLAKGQGSVTGLVLGGDSHGLKWRPEMAADIADKLKAALSRDEVLLVTPSRRTPPMLLQAIKEALPAGKTVWYDDGSENAYQQILSIADRLIVTGDSHNMVSEALSTGSPVYVYRPEGLQMKLERFLSAMREQGAIRDFDGALVPFEGVKLDATAEIAQSLEERL